MYLIDSLMFNGYVVVFSQYVVTYLVPGTWQKLPGAWAFGRPAGRLIGWVWEADDLPAIELGLFSVNPGSVNGMEM